MSNEASASVVGVAKEIEHLLQAATKRIRQCIGTVGGQRESIAGLRSRLLGEHSDNALPEETPEPVRHDIEELNHQITILQDQQEIVGQHIEALQQL